MTDAGPRPRVEIGGRPVGGGDRCFVIAEAGVNHDGDVETAHRLVDAAADAGTDAVKFQTFRADAVAAAVAPKAGYQVATTGGGESQVEMLRRLELDPDVYGALKEHAEERGLVFLSSPFDSESVDVLDRLGVAAFKVASPDLVNLPLLEEIGARSRPVFLSTGMADLDEVRRAVSTLEEAGAGGIVLLHCVSAYPASPDEANLRALATLESSTGLPTGYSDHTEGDEVALAAVALGACALEKHFTLDRSAPGPDHRASLEPEELAALVRRVRLVESALGDGVKRPTPSEQENAVAVRRSLAAAGDLAAGAVLTRAMLTALRPATGIPPAELDQVVGRRLRRAVRRYELIEPADLE